jgi:hypothetical protein
MAAGGGYPGLDLMQAYQPQYWADPSQEVRDWCARALSPWLV